MAIQINIENEYIIITDIEINDLVLYNKSFLNTLLSEDKVSFNEFGKLVLPFEAFYTLSDVERSALGFYKRCPFDLSLTTNGALLLPNFKVEYKFKMNGRTIKGLKLSDHINIEKDGEIFTLPSNLARIISLINIHANLNSITNKEEKGDVFNELMLHLPSELKSTDDRLKTVQVNYADCFTVSLEVDDQQVHPQLLCSDGDTVLLNPTLDEKFKTMFFSGGHVQSYYHLGHNKFVFIPNRLKKTLNVIKEIQQKSTSERLGFYYNPSAEIDKKILEGQLESSDLELFKETKHYISERIQKLGVWNPKNYTFESGTKNTWIPADSIVIFIEGSFYHFKDSEIGEIQDQVKVAKEAGSDFIEVGGETIKITPEFVEEIAKAKSKIDENYSNNLAKEDGVDLDSVHEESLVSKPLVPIIYDNIEGDFFHDKLKPHPNLSKDSVNSLLTYSLHSHQKICLDWLQDSFIKGRRGVLLADDMGLGKTFQTLAFLVWIKREMMNKRESGGPFLIVGPTALLKNWEQEHHNTLQGDGLGDLVEAYGSSFLNLKKMGTEKAVERLNSCSWALTTYTSMKNNHSIFRRVDWKVLVFDEIQAIKNPNSFVTEMAKALATDFTIGLTGTPVENSLLDLWCISDSVWSGILGIYSQFKENYQGTDADLKGLKNALSYDNPPPFMMRRMKEDEIDGLTTKKEIIIEEMMGDIQARAYDVVLENAQSGVYNDNPFEVVHRLRRISLGAWHERMNDDEVSMSSARLKATLKILDEIKVRNEKVLIFVESREFQQILIPLLSKRYKFSKPPMLINGATPTKIRQKYVDIFQESKDGFDIMLISPGAGGTGFTITAANNVIHLERMWNPAKEDQCSDRVYRLGQTKEVNIYIPQAIHERLLDSSFDKVIHELLSKKRKISRDVICPTGLRVSDKTDIFEKTSGISKDKVANQTDFYRSKEWRDLSGQFKAGHNLQCSNVECGISYPRIPKSEFHVDHIKPRSKFPELALDYDNLQILCVTCNLKKGSKIT